MSKFVPIDPKTFKEIVENPEILRRANKILRQHQTEDVLSFIKKGILTEKEYVSKYKGKYENDDGCCSFVQYIHATQHEEERKMKNSRFITIHPQMLKDRDKLSKRFGLKIMLLREMVEKDET